MNLVKNNKFFLIGLLILVGVVFINLFPKGYVFGGGDTSQLINVSQGSFFKLFFDWEGRASLFYVIFYLLSLVGISNSLQLSFCLGFILFGSYLSFWFFSKLIFPKLTELPRFFASLFYALNLYTLFLFTGNWGYSHFPSLYVFIPILVGLYVKFLDSQKIIYGLWFCLVLFLGSSGFGNPAFALSFAIFLFLLTLIFLCVKKSFLNRLFFGKIMLVVIFSLLVSASWMFPLAPQLQGGVESLASSNVVDFSSWMRSTSSPMEYTLSLFHYSDKHFPLNFYYKNFDFLKPIFILLSFLPIILITSFLVFSKNIEKNRKVLFFSLLGLLLLFVMLVARYRFPFETINYYIYSIWGFNTLRGYDKTAIYIPFIFSFLILIGLVNFRNKKLAYALIIISLLAPLPFYVGKLQQTAGYRVNSKKDYREAKMSFLVKIPDEYYSIRETLNSDEKKSKIATLPETYSDGSGIVYYPKWNFYGSDILRFLYSKSFIGANSDYFKDWNYANDFSGKGSLKNNDWVVKLLGMMNAQYILFHKDAPESSVKKTLFKMKDLESRGLIKNLEENDFFILYEITGKEYIPYITWQAETFDIQGNITSIERNVEKIKASISETNFKEVNPKKFTIDLEENKEIGENLVLAETFNPLWKAYYKLDNGKEVEIKNHFKARGYANGWTVDKNIQAEKIIVEYYPIRLMWRGMIISGATVLFLIIYLLKYYYVKRKNIKS
jgi:hypothetical protein